MTTDPLTAAPSPVAAGAPAQISASPSSVVAIRAAPVLTLIAAAESSEAASWRTPGDQSSDLLEDPLVDALDEMAQSVDITKDVAVLQWLQSGPTDCGWSAKEKRRVKARAARFFLEEGDTLYRKPTGRFPARRVPAIADRLPIIEGLHLVGHYGIMRTMSMVQQHLAVGLAALVASSGSESQS